MTQTKNMLSLTSGCFYAESFVFICPGFKLCTNFIGNSSSEATVNNPQSLREPLLSEALPQKEIVPVRTDDNALFRLVIAKCLFDFIF